MTTGEWIQISVAVVLTVTLAALLWYAWETRKIAREMHEQRLEGARPVLSLNWKLYDGKVGKDPSVEVSVRNVGSGVALRIEYAFSHPRFAYTSMWLPLLGPQDDVGMQRLVRRASEDKSDVDASVGTIAHIVATYEDIHGRLFETRMALEQNYLGWTERGAQYQMTARRAPEDRGPQSANVWYKVTSSGSVLGVTDDP